MEAVFKTAVQDMIEDAQTPRDKGGLMPVVTSFLRNSGSAAINSIPTGGGFGNTAVVISRAKLGDTIYFGWTANYAQYMEAKYAFMRMATQRWGQFVKVAARRIEQGGK